MRRFESSRRRSLCMLAVAALAVTTLGNQTLARPATADALREQVYEAAMTTYIHGMTEEIARSEFGPQSVPFLLELLGDPSFPRRDNVVAVLGYVGSGRATSGLLRFLQDPPASLEIAVEDRALLLAPQSLGQIASRGERQALRALLAMTAPGSKGGILGAAASRGPRPVALRDDLLQMALRGLAYSGAREARGRLDAIAQGRSKPAGVGRNLERSARTALELFDELSGGGSLHESAAPDTPRTDGLQSVSPSAGDAESDLFTRAFDGSHVNVNHSRLDYANHVNVTDPMTDSRLDDSLAEASLRMGKADFAADVACCAGLQRMGTAQQFGSAGDGLDLIDNSTELNSVLNHSVSRFKVVRAINYCGSPGTNIIGCAWVGGDGAAVVRYGSVGTEGVLWAHEYGHNTGLSHNNSGSSYIMYGYLGSGNTALTQAECDRFHTPTSGARADLVDIGNCTDGDLDEVQDLVDNCPLVSNNDQLDADGDGVGDVCESGCGSGAIDGVEECDGSDLGGRTCQGLGYDGGNLACNADCTLDDSACTTCGDGAREGDEACDGADLGGASCDDQLCTGGSVVCTAGCTLDYGNCTGCPVCDNDGVCETEEDCNGCPGDCVSGPGASCGNGICEAADGEDCANCPQDCRGRQNGRPANRYCCGAGGGENPVDCSNSDCNSGEWVCTNDPAVASCCGDLGCEGIENSFNCEIDCGPPPFCGDGVCNGGEDSCSCAGDCGLPPATEIFCADGVDDDCDGLADCSDSVDCANDAACNQTCAPLQASCTTDGDCCSNKCRGRSGSKTCK